MIISASRRTDIPAFYAPWFLNRLGEGHVLVPNPFNPRSVSRVSLRPDAVDCIVFWTKNPAPMLPRLGELNGFKYYFQFTLNPYGKDIERNLPSIEERIETFRKLSEMIGKERVVWRYDPILINETYDTRFHREAFARLARKLSNHTERCMGSASSTAIAISVRPWTAGHPSAGNAARSNRWPPRSDARSRTARSGWKHAQSRSI